MVVLWLLVVLWLVGLGLDVLSVAVGVTVKDGSRVADFLRGQSFPVPWAASSPSKAPEKNTANLMTEQPSPSPAVLVPAACSTNPVPSAFCLEKRGNLTSC